MANNRNSGWISALAIGGALAALFWLERRYPLRPAKPQPDRQRVTQNVAIAATTAMVLRLCERPLVEPLAHWVDRRQMGLLPRLKLSRPVEKMLGVLLLDYTLYWWHRLLHHLPFLWRSHVVHHSDLVLDSTTALRFHGMEFLASVPWRLAQVALLGIRPSTLALWQKLTTIEVLFHHSNLRLPPEVENRLRHIVVTPRMHGIHHSVKPQELNTNFSSGLTVWDVLHGTLKTDVPQEAIEIGVCEQHDPKELVLPHLLALPFREKRTAQARQ
jgi:sterol desaturase/sphingolipid hydroxylase (fatty acid hydroxylase superfamily)